MAAYLSVIKQLEKGRELCGYCGRDITGEPDCLHANPNDWSYTVHHQTYPTGHRALKTALFNPKNSMRLGMEVLLMGVPYLKSLPLCDPDPTIGLRQINLSLLVRPS